MKKLFLALAALAGAAALTPATVESASAATRIIVRHDHHFRPAPRHRCVTVTRVVRGPHGRVRRISEHRCR
jgi:hypothetical protein